MRRVYGIRKVVIIKPYLRISKQTTSPTSFGSRTQEGEESRRCEELNNVGRKEDINARTRYVSSAGSVATGKRKTCRND